MPQMTRNLLTFSFSLPAGQSIVLEQAPARAKFAVAAANNTNQQDLRIWIGPTDPPAAAEDWIPIEDTAVSLQEGVLGPVYIAAVGNQASDVAILSAYDEAAGATTAALSSFTGSKVF